MSLEMGRGTAFPCSENREGRKRRLLFEAFAACSSVSQLGPVRLDMETWRAWTGGEDDCIPTRGAPVRDELPPLGKGSLLEPRRFSLAQEERHPSSHAGTTASHH